MSPKRQIPPAKDTFGHSLKTPNVLCLGGPEEPWKLVSTPPTTLGEPPAEQMQEEVRGRVFIPGKVRPSDPDPAGLGTESAKTLPVNRADTAGEAEPLTGRAELSTRPRRELRQGQPGSERPADGAPVTTSCSSLQARQGEDPRGKGLSDAPEVALRAARQTGDRGRDRRAVQSRGEREGVELGADPGLPAGGGKLADEDEAPKG